MFEPDNASVHTFLTNLQTIIARMGAYSSSCKQWCVTLVSAILVLGIDKEKNEATIVGLLSVLLFCLLDAYYLSLERDFRKTYNNFVAKLASDDYKTEVFIISLPATKGYRVNKTLAAMVSISVVWFYIILAIAVISVRVYIQSQPVLQVVP